VLDVAVSTVDILRVVHKDKDINKKYYLIAIFGEGQHRQKVPHVCIPRAAYAHLCFLFVLLINSTNR